MSLASLIRAGEMESSRQATPAAARLAPGKIRFGLVVGPAPRGPAKVETVITSSQSVIICPKQRKSCFFPVPALLHCLDSSAQPSLAPGHRRTYHRGTRGAGLELYQVSSYTMHTGPGLYSTQTRQSEQSANLPPPQPSSSREPGRGIHYTAWLTHAGIIKTDWAVAASLH